MGKSNFKHGHAVGYTRTRELRAWQQAKDRCLNPANSHYLSYGGRGITFCDRWLHSFESFIADMGPEPPNASLDRIDVNGPYEPRNCRWADAKTQRRNQRIPIDEVTIDGHAVALVDAVATHGVNQWTLRRLLKKGIPADEAIAALKEKRPGEWTRVGRWAS